MPRRSSHSAAVAALLAALLAPLPSSAQAFAVDVGVLHATNVDQTLSPLRYSGNVLELRAAAARRLRGVTLNADAQLAAGTLSTDVTSSQRPELHTTAVSGAIGIERVWGTLRTVDVAPGLRVVGRVAGREHQFTGAQSGNRYPGSMQPSFDQVLALQPTLRLMKVRAGGAALGAAAALSIAGTVRHPYYPSGISERTARWRIGGPRDVLVADGELRWLHGGTSRTRWGARYALRLLRLAGTSHVAEVSHQLGLVVGWGGR